MFSGIVQGTFPVAAIVDSEGLRRLTIRLSDALIQGLEIGASVSVNGVCLTVVAINGGDVNFDVINETLKQTILATLKVGDRVNIERSIGYGQEIGGHILSGHIDGVARVAHIDTSVDENVELTLSVSPRLMPYILTKGFIALNGCSLTVASADPENACFCVCLIPETRRVTNLGDLVENSRLNIEIDRQTQAIVDTVNRYMLSQHSTAHTD